MAKMVTYVASVERFTRQAPFSTHTTNRFQEDTMSVNSTPDFVNETTWKKVKAYQNNFTDPTPVLLMDLDVIRRKAEIIGKQIENSKVFYAIKANPDLRLARMLDDMGMGFEIASSGELQVLKTMGVAPEKIITGNTIKTVDFIRQLYSYGVHRFAFDSEAEVRKIAQHAPGSGVYIRLTVPNEGSEWPLSKKFGVELEEACELLVQAQESGLDPVGITFHVGSQCTNIHNWDSAIEKSRTLWDMASDRGIKLSLLNIGGGYPIDYTKPVDDIRTIDRRVDKLLKENFPEDIDVYIEPGRGIVGDAGVFLASIIGKAKRDDENWLYVDVGVFGGMMESIGGIKYSYVVESCKAPKKWIVAGPSCDSFDVMDHGVVLPEPELGDSIFILGSGAYTTAYASQFNGFAIPKTVIL
jgi:ornithine decarboxylase